MISLLKVYISCELRHKVNLISHVVIVLCSYFILQMGLTKTTNSFVFTHALIWFLSLYLMNFVAIDMSNRYRSNDFEKGLVCFTAHQAHLFYAKVIVHVLIVSVPTSMVFLLLSLQGMVFPCQTYALYVLGISLLSCMSQLLSALLVQLPNKNLALPLMLFPISSPAILFLYSVAVKSMTIGIHKELLSVVGMILVVLSLGQLCANITLEES